MANEKTKFAWPRDDERTLVLGDTGSGKTQMAAFLLSLQNFKRKPWVIVDYKGDDLLGALERTREIDLHEVPKKPGLYIVRPLPTQDDDVENWLWKIWERENIGLYADEGALIPNAATKESAWATIAITGRSKRIPTITLSQRPTGISRYTVSQSSHVVMFNINDERDIDTATSIVPRDFPTWLPPEFSAQGHLPEYHSRWYTVANRGRFVLRPVPDAAAIRASIDNRLEPKIRWT